MRKIFSCTSAYFQDSKNNTAGPRFIPLQVLQNETESSSEARKQVGELGTRLRQPGCSGIKSLVTHQNNLYFCCLLLSNMIYPFHQSAALLLDKTALWDAEHGGTSAPEHSAASALGGCEDFMPPPTFALCSSSDLAEQTHTCYI